MDEMSLTLAGETVRLAGDRVLAWRNTLFLADVHFGKDAMLRESHHWAPPGSTAATLCRLTDILRRRPAGRLVILGDVFHSHHAVECVPAIRRWRDEHRTCEILVVPGNHDRRAGSLFEDCGFVRVPEGHSLGPWILRHHPPHHAESFTLCGHVHPHARFRGSGRHHLRLPCFLISASCCVLPAFGEFTGGQVVHPRPGEHVVAVVDGQVVSYACARMKDEDRPGKSALSDET